jgi:hypothetical protein
MTLSILFFSEAITKESCCQSPSKQLFPFLSRISALITLEIKTTTFIQRRLSILKAAAAIAKTKEFKILM